MTTDQQLMLAREARRLAMECVNGTAPELGPAVLTTPTCAIGVIAWRALREKTYLHVRGALEEEEIVCDANDEADEQSAREARLVFPLLALADALEDAAEPQS